MTEAEESLEAVLKRRHELDIRLRTALAHLDWPSALYVVTSYIPLDDLQRIVEHQEEKSRIDKTIDAGSSAKWEGGS